MRRAKYRVDSTVSYTRNHRQSLAHQIREYLRTHGASVPVDVARGITWDEVGRRAILTNVSITMARMANSGSLHREKMARTSHYSLNDQILVGARNRNAIGKALTSQVTAVEKLQEMSLRAEPEIRAEVLSEMYFRLSCGRYAGAARYGKLYADSLKAVRRARAGGHRERYSMDAPLGEDGNFDRNDVLADDTSHEEDGVKLTLLEWLVDSIKAMIEDGYWPDQYEHLWCSCRSNWRAPVMA